MAISSVWRLSRRMNSLTSSVADIKTAGDGPAANATLSGHQAPTRDLAPGDDAFWCGHAVQEPGRLHRAIPPKLCFGKTSSTQGSLSRIRRRRSGRYGPTPGRPSRLWDQSPGWNRSVLAPMTGLNSHLAHSKHPSIARCGPIKLCAQAEFPTRSMQPMQRTRPAAAGA